MAHPRLAMLFLDRDGTLMDDVGYPKDPAEVRLVPDAAEAVRYLVGHGFVPAVVSNQSGIGRGMITQEQANAVHERFVALFEQASGVRLPCYYCPHAPEAECDCRKPMPGLLRQAAAELGMRDKPGAIVGDKLSDVEAAHSAMYDAVLFCRVPPQGNVASSGRWCAVADTWWDVLDHLEARLETWLGGPP